MSPSRGDGDEPLGAAAAASAGASTATEEAGLPSVPAPAFEGWQPPGEQQRQQRPRWLRWALGRVGGGLLLVAVLVAAIVLGVTLRAGGGGRSKGAATTGPGPGGTGEGGAVLPSTVTGLDAAKQQQPPPPPPEGSVGNRNGTAAGGSPPQIATAPPGKGQAAGAAATLNELAKQLLGEGGVNPGLGGGILEGEEEDEAEDSFIAVEGCTPHNYPELHFLVERECLPPFLSQLIELVVDDWTAPLTDVCGLFPSPVTHAPHHLQAPPAPSSRWCPASSTTLRSTSWCGGPWRSWGAR